jgi:protein-disulfide isomerase
LASRKEQREQARAEREAREAAERAKAQRNRRMLQLGGALAAAAVIVVVAIVISSGGSDKKGGSKGGTAAAAEVQQLLNGIPQRNLTIGNPKAPVTLIEFADLKCPFCQQYTVNTQPDLVARYVRTGKVKMVWRNLAFVGNDPADTQAAALATLAAGRQNKLWDFADVFYRNQLDEANTYVTDEFVMKIARAVPGLDVNKLLADRGSPEVRRELEVAQSEASKLGVNSTPTFFLQRGSAPPQRVGDSQQLAQAINQLLQGR